MFGEEIDMVEEARFRISARLFIPREELRFEYSRSGGPGGQNVNKVNSKAVLRWSIDGNRSLPEHVRERLRVLAGRKITNDGELLLVGQRYRDQPKNVEDCLERLRQLVLESAVVQRKRIRTKPTRGSVQRRLTEKKSASQKKQSRRGRYDQD